MIRKHATMTDGEDICLAFQSEHGGFDCSEASIDRVSGALICNDGTLEGLGEGVADAAIYPTAEIFAGARLLALDRVAEGYADGRDAHAIDAAAKSVAESVRRNCIEVGGAGASMIDFARHPFAASQWIDENFKTSISEVDARRLMQDLTLVDISRLDRSRPLIEGMGAQAHEGILAFLDGMEELRTSSVDVELFDRLMTDDFNVVRTLGRDRSREFGTVTVHGRDIEISCTLADGFCATARPQAGTVLTFSSRRRGWHGFQSSPLSFGGSTVSIRHDMPSVRLARDFDLAALSAEAETAMRELGVPVPAALKYVKEECERVSARCDEIEAKIGTFDSYLYSIVERKQRFISQVFTNKSPVRTMDDLDETVLSLAQMKQIAEGDPTVAERMDVENKIGQLKLMLASHLDGLADVQHKIETQYRPLVEALTAQRDMLADDEIPFAEADLVRQQTLGSKDSFLTVGGTHIADKEEAIRALRRAAYDVRPGCEETIGTYRGLSVVCRRQRVLDDDWLPYIGLAVDAARHVHMSDRVFPSGEKGAFTVLTQMDRIIARDAKGPAEIELKLRDAQLALADAQKAAREPFPKQAELDEAEQRLAVLEQECIEDEAQRQREQAQRAEAEAAAIEEGVEEERAAEREHERAAVADDEAREAGRVAELRRQGLICEDSATHAAATAAPNGIASGCPDDVAEAARCSAAASAREEAGGGEKHKAGM